MHNTKPPRKVEMEQSVGLMEVVGKSWKIWGAMEGLVVLQVWGDTTETGAEHLLVAEESDWMRLRKRQTNSVFSTVPPDVTPARSEEKGVNTRTNLPAG